MDGGISQAAGAEGAGAEGAGAEGARSRWRSTIPGVSQRDGAPATLGLAAWGLGHRGAQAAAGGGAASGWAGESTEAGGMREGGPRGFGPAGPSRARRGLPWRAITLGGLALLAILGVARVAGAEGPRLGIGSERASGDGAAGGVARTAEPGVSGRVEPTGGHEAAPTGAPEPVPPPTPMAAPDAPVAPNAAGTGPPDWWEVLAELDRRRARALTALDPDLVAAYARPESPVWSADTGLVADLRARGLRPLGLGSRVLAVERAELRSGQARVQIVDKRSGYSLVDAHGEVVESVPAAGLTRWSVALAEEPRDPVGWRVVDVTAESNPGAAGDPSGAAGS